MGGFMPKRMVGLLAVVAVPLALPVTRMRKVSPVLKHVRRISRSMTNPRLMLTAGSAGGVDECLHLERESAQA
jgi:hypothetical protein